VRPAPSVRAALILGCLFAGIFVLLPMVSGAADPGALRERADQARARERSLEGAVARLTAADRRLARQVAALQRRQAAIQADLDRDEATLARTREDLRRERARAARLARRLTQAREMLRTRLLERYKASDVDALSVVLNSASFADLMERAAFLRRIQDSDEEIVKTVRVARADAIAERRRLDALEARQQRAVEGLRARRNAIAGMAEGVRARQAALQRIRAARAAALAATRRNRQKVERDLRAAEEAAARAASAGAPASVPTGGWAIPWEVVQCESGGQNLPPNHAGASGYYQIMPATWKGLGGRGPHAYLRPKAEQDAAAAKLWNGGKGAHNWVCYGMVN
jgi:peptidoglycan hydrolase CwlO-like protein